MPEPNTTRKSGRPVRFVKASQAGRRPKKKAVSRRAPARPSTVRRRAASLRTEEKMPAWGELSRGSKSRLDGGGLFAAVSTLKLALMIIAVAAVVTLYVGHVYATSALLSEVEGLRRANLELYLEHNQVKAQFDRASGPGSIAARARALGLVESVPTGTPIRLDGR